MPRTLRYDSIRDILTLRYNSAIRPNLPKLSQDDFRIAANSLEKGLVEGEIRDVLRGAVKGEASVALSGGVDSTLVLALLRKSMPDLKIRAMTAVFADGVDESPQAARIAEYFGAEHEIIRLENFLEELPAAIGMTGQPFWDIHWYHIAKNARGRSLVSGDGGDELFGGYTFRYKKFLSMVDGDTPPEARVMAYLRCHERDWVEDQEDVFGEGIGFSWEYIRGMLMPYFENPLPPIQQVFLADYNGKLLYNFSPVNTALCRGFGTRPVTPLLSGRIIRYAAHLDPGLKYDRASDAGKLPLSEMLADHMDLGMLTRAKQGFSVDTEGFWKSHGYGMCETYLCGARIADAGWASRSWIEKNLRPTQDVRNINKMLGLLALEVWYRIFVTSEMGPKTRLEA